MHKVDFENVTLWHGDCLDVLPLLSGVDAVITDPPYGITACKWDSLIPLQPMWSAIKSILKQQGACVLFSAQPFTSALVMSNIEWFKYEDIWEKSKATGFLNAEKRPLRAHENVLVFCDGSPTYNPQKWKINPIFMDRRKTFSVLDASTHIYGAMVPKARRKDDGFRYPLSVIPICSDWQKGMHTTQKPVDLMLYLVKTYTNENETIVDFTMGCGTTGVACIRSGRKFIGIEKDATHFATACKRIEQELSQGQLAL